MVRIYAFVLTALAGGCGLISSDITDVDLSLPNKTYTVDSASFGVTGDPGPVLSMTCTPSSGACELAAMQVCPDGQCRGACGDTNTCELIIPVHPFTTVDLAAEKPELATINDQALIDVTIDTITYAVSENTMDTQTPPLTLYVAPANVMTPDDPAAVPIGTIPPVTPGMTVPVTQIEMTTVGRTRLVQAMQDFRTPFTVLIAADIVIGMGDAIPTGRMTTTLSITAHAGI